MKTTNKLMLTVLALGASTCVMLAQDNYPPGPDGPGPGPGGPGAGGRRPPLLPVFLALDTNHDGVIDSNEIANASVALKTLDKKGDGKLTVEELMGPPPPRRMGGQFRGNGGPGGPGGPGGFGGPGGRGPGGPGGFGGPGGPPGGGGPGGPGGYGGPSDGGPGGPGGPDGGGMPPGPPPGGQ